MSNQDQELPVNKTVLVVDDDQAVLNILHAQLLQAGFSALVASSGEEALRYMQEQHPPIVISDWNMPGMTGLDLCRQVRGTPDLSLVYFIILTAHADRERVLQAFEAGVNDFLPKTLDLQELLGRLRAALRIVSLEQRLTAQKRILEETNAQLVLLNRRLEMQATTDELTGLPNRRHGLVRLHECHSASDRHDQPLSCLMLDIDHFKRCNDTHGHDAGDAVLCGVAETIRRHIRASDIACRMGGEEFLVICPYAAADNAAELGERLRHGVADLAIQYGAANLSVTVSVGVAERDDPAVSATELLKRADQALYAAKHSGRNTVCIYDRARPVEHARAETRVVLAPGRRRRPYTALIADHDAWSRGFRRGLLEADGWRVIETEDGPQTLTVAARELPDVVLIGSFASDLNAIDCVRTLKSQRRTRNVSIFMTGASDRQEQGMAALEAGADECMLSPLPDEEFLIRLRKLAEVRRTGLRLRRMNRRQRQESSLMCNLLELFKAAAGQQHMDAVLDNAIEITAGVTGARRVSIMLPDSERQTLVIARAIGLREEIIRDTRVPVGSGTAGRVFASGRAIAADGRTGPEGGLHYENAFVSAPMISMPLSASGVIVGVLNLTDRMPPRPFTRRELRYIELICSASAAAIYQTQAQRIRDELSLAIVSAMATLTEYRDDDTGKHIERVTQFSMILADELRKRPEYADKIDAQFMTCLRRAVPLHDIGKVAIPDSILLKAGSLSPSEMNIMRAHADIGAHTLESLIKQQNADGFLLMARDIASCHHERYDGTGYPRGLRGEEIPLSARIAAVADVYDALTRRRVYKPAQSHAEAVTIIRRGAGSQFDPTVVEAFLGCEHRLSQAADALVDTPSRLLPIYPASSNNHWPGAQTNQTYPNRV